MNDLHRAIGRELADARAAAGRIEQLLAEDLSTVGLAHALVELGRVNADLGAVVERLEGEAQPDWEGLP